MTVTIGYTSVGLLSRFNQYAGRPDAVSDAGAADVIPNTTKYMFLADAEKLIIERLSAIDAKIFYGAPQLMTTADGGYTYTFGTGPDTVAMFPCGRTQIFPNVNCLPGYALTPGVDYLDEGTRIRCPNNVPIPAPLYWYGLQETALLSDTTPPVLHPAQANLLTVIKAVADFSESGHVLDGALADRMTLRFEREFGYMCTAIRKHFRGSGNGAGLLSPWAAAFGPGLSSAAST